MVEQKKIKKEKKLDKKKVLPISKTVDTKLKKNRNTPQIEKQNKILKNFFLIIGILILVLIFWFVFSYFQTNFTYEGIKFNTIQEGKLILYHARLPVFYQGKNVNYNLYLRKNPKKSKVNLEGDLNLKEMAVLNVTGEFKCEGDGVIGAANLVQSLGIFGTKVINDKNATCDELGRYTFIKILSGEKTKIEKFGPSCYNLYVNNCEILDVTEKFIVESFVQKQNLK